MEPGDYRLHVSAEGYASKTVDVTVGGGELRVAPLQGVEAARQQLLHLAAHLRDLLVEQVQLLIVRPDDVLIHGTASSMTAAAAVARRAAARSLQIRACASIGGRNGGARNPRVRLNRRAQRRGEPTARLYRKQVAAL